MTSPRVREEGRANYTIDKTADSRYDGKAHAGPPTPPLLEGKRGRIAAHAHALLPIRGSPLPRTHAPPVQPSRCTEQNAPLPLHHSPRLARARVHCAFAPPPCPLASLYMRPLQPTQPPAWPIFLVLFLLLLLPSLFCFGRLLLLWWWWTGGGG